MSHPRSYRAGIAATMLLVAAHTLTMLSSVAASAATPPPVPAAIAVPPGYELLFSSHAEGVQTYECQDGSWGFRAPRALLFEPETGRPLALHYGGVDRQ